MHWPPASADPELDKGSVSALLTAHPGPGPCAAGGRTRLGLYGKRLPSPEPQGFCKGNLRPLGIDEGR